MNRESRRVRENEDDGGRNVNGNGGGGDADRKMPPNMVQQSTERRSSSTELSLDNESLSMTSATSSSLPTPMEEKVTPKKKRRSPAVPWKKPKDMPRRPLSAYNLFFKAEREKLIGERESNAVSAGPELGEEGKATEQDSSVLSSSVHVVSPETKKKGQKKGIGFANLAKTIASKWKTLDPKSKEPFEKQAAIDKQRYDEAVAKWRVKQKKDKALKKEAEQAAAAAAAAESREKNSVMARAMHFHSSSPIPLSPHLSPEGRGNFSDRYPAEWFDISPGTVDALRAPVGLSPVAYGDVSMADESGRSCISYSSFDSSQRSLEQAALHGQRFHGSSTSFGSSYASLEYPPSHSFRSQPQMQRPFYARRQINLQRDSKTADQDASMTSAVFAPPVYQEPRRMQIDSSNDDSLFGQPLIPVDVDPLSHMQSPNLHSRHHQDQQNQLSLDTHEFAEALPQHPSQVGTDAGYATNRMRPGYQPPSSTVRSTAQYRTETLPSTLNFNSMRQSRGIRALPRPPLLLGVSGASGQRSQQTAPSPQRYHESSSKAIDSKHLSPWNAGSGSDHQSAHSQAAALNGSYPNPRYTGLAIDPSLRQSTTGERTEEAGLRGLNHCLDDDTIDFITDHPFP